jgi:hypothetical protein
MYHNNAHIPQSSGIVSERRAVKSEGVEEAGKGVLSTKEEELLSLIVKEGKLMLKYGETKDEAVWDEVLMIRDEIDKIKLYLGIPSRPKGGYVMD